MRMQISEVTYVHIDDFIEQLIFTILNDVKPKLALGFGQYGQLMDTFVRIDYFITFEIPTIYITEIKTYVMIIAIKTQQEAQVNFSGPW